MRVAAGLLGGFAVAMWALYGVAINSIHATGDPVSFLLPVWWVDVLGGIALVAAVLFVIFTIRAARARSSRKTQEAVTASTPSSVRVTIPGRVEHGGLIADMNIDRSYTIRYRSNHAVMGRLTAGTAGAFNVEHLEVGNLGQAASVEDGMQMLEDRDKLRQFSFRMFPGVGRGWLLQRLWEPPAHVSSVMVWDANGTPKTTTYGIPAGGALQAPIDRRSAGYLVGVELEPGDTFEVHWTEDGEYLSTSVRLYDGQREYFLRRENTGH